MEIQKMLTISTAHVTPATMEKLGEDARGGNNFPFIGVYEKLDFGCFIYIQKELYADAIKSGTVPGNLLVCIDLALANDCSILCFDCDGLTCDLPQYDWDKDTLPDCDLS